METLELNTHGIDVDSAEFAEELLTSPELTKSADAARSSLLQQYYSDGLSNHSMYDVISLAKTPFRDQLEAMQQDEHFDLYAHRELANTLFAASSNIANYLGLDLTNAIEQQKHMTMYGRSPLDGIANMLVMLGAGIFDQE